MSLLRRALERVFVKQNSFNIYALIVFLFLIIIVLPESVLATVNIETLRSGEEENGFDSTLAYSFYEASGNTEIESHKTTLRTDYQTDSYDAFLVVSEKRGKKADALYMDKGFVHLRFIMPVSKVITPEVFIQKEYNDFTLLLDRRLGGGGLRFALLKDNPNYNIHLGLGAMREREVLDLTPNLTTRYTRFTNYLSMKFKINETLSFTGTGYYQPRLDKSEDYRILFDGGFTFKITKHLDFAVEVNHRRDSLPPLGVEKDDTEITNSIKVRF